VQGSLWVVESRVIRRSRFACLLPVVVFILLRALSHAHPAPFPWMLGVFDGGGLDDVLQGVRIPYARSADASPEHGQALRVTTGRVVMTEPLLAVDGVVVTTRCRAPPSI
jgi:hypothetical protein